MSMPFKKEELQRMKQSKVVANSISDYLNQLERIFTEPMTEQQKVEAFNQGALYTGKLMVAFANLCDLLKIYEERGVKGGVIRKKAEPKKEEQYEFKEV